MNAANRVQRKKVPKYDLWYVHEQGKKIAQILNESEDLLHTLSPPPAFVEGWEQPRGLDEQTKKGAVGDSFPDPKTRVRTKTKAWRRLYPPKTVEETKQRCDNFLCEGNFVGLWKGRIQKEIRLLGWR